MENKSSEKKNSLTVKNKLLIIGVLYLVSIIAVEMFTSFNGANVRQTVADMQLRQQQLGLVNEIKISFGQLTLAAMDAIVDKESGQISGELQQEMSEAKKMIDTDLVELEKAADTGEERELARKITAMYPEYEKAVMVDLPRLIATRAEQNEFDRIDDLIDGLNNSLSSLLAELASSVEKENVEASEAMIEQLSTFSLVRRIFAAAMLLAIGTVLFFIGRAILVPIVSASRMIKDVAEGEGDLTKRLVASNDEIGTLSGWFNVFVSKLHGIISQIHTNLDTLNSSAAGLAKLSTGLGKGAEDATQRSNTVASAAEEMSANMSAVAAASEQASVNVNMVASAAEEMSATISEIATNTARARQITQEAVSKTDQASVRVDELGGAADEISKVTEVITEISEQTNLLALNATIEAARAGEAGKGFAVVANEIKELAKQTAEATLEIRQKIEAIQGSTHLTVTEISDINAIINDVNEIVGTIATAVEQQAASTEEIATNISQAAQGISEVNENVSQSSTVSGDISTEISGVSQVAELLLRNSGDVKRQSDELTELAGQLGGIVRQFKL